MVAIAIVVSIVVILIGIEADYVSSLHKKEMQAGKDIINTLGNLRNEYHRIVEISLSEDPTIYNLNHNIMDFSAFVDDKLTSKQSLLFYSIAESKGDELGVIVGNFLSEDIDDVSISQNLTDESVNIESIGVGGSETVYFNVSPATSNGYLINVNYTGSSSDVEYEKSYRGELGSGKGFVVYYNLKVALDDSFVRDRFRINEDVEG